MKIRTNGARQKRLAPQQGDRKMKTMTMADKRWMVMTFTMDFFYGTPDEVVEEMHRRCKGPGGESPREYMDGYADRAMVWAGVRTDIRTDTAENFLEDAERHGLLWIDKTPTRNYLN